MIKDMDYKKVIAAFKSGEINPENWRLCFDNDGGCWEWVGDELCDNDLDKKISEMEGLYGLPDGYSDLVKLASDAGINADWV